MSLGKQDKFKDTRDDFLSSKDIENELKNNSDTGEENEENFRAALHAARKTYESKQKRKKTAIWTIIVFIITLAALIYFYVI